MAQIPFTLRELQRAWKALRLASSQIPRTNAHRLLLIYSVECGLKAVWLRRESRTLFVASDIVIRRESAHWCEARAKLVRPDFTQAIGEHWSRRRIEWNRLDWAAHRIGSDAIG